MVNAEPVWSGELLLIAEFARRCRLPVSTLRYYDRVGLLRPAAVDRDTGYRRYGPDQVPAALMIGRLRAIGTAPDVIALVLTGGATAAAALAAERDRLTAEITERRDALTRLDELSAAPGRGECRDIDLPPGRVVAREFSVPFPDLVAGITRAVATLRADLRRRGALTSSPGWGALLPLDLDDTVTGHVFARIGADDALPTVALPHGPAVEVTQHGAPGDVALGYHVALARLDHRGRRPGPVVIEDYPPPSPDGSRHPIRISVPVS